MYAFLIVLTVTFTGEIPGKEAFYYTSKERFGYSEPCMEKAQSLAEWLDDVTTKMAGKQAVIHTTASCEIQETSGI